MSESNQIPSSQGKSWFKELEQDWQVAGKLADRDVKGVSGKREGKASFGHKFSYLKEARVVRNEVAKAVTTFKSIQEALKTGSGNVDKLKKEFEIVEKSLSDSVKKDLSGIDDNQIKTVADKLNPNSVDKKTSTVSSSVLSSSARSEVSSIDRYNTQIESMKPPEDGCYNKSQHLKGLNQLRLNITKSLPESDERTKLLAKVDGKISQCKITDQDLELLKKVLGQGNKGSLEREIPALKAMLPPEGDPMYAKCMDVMVSCTSYIEKNKFLREISSLDVQVPSNGSIKDKLEFIDEKLGELKRVRGEIEKEEKLTPSDKEVLFKKIDKRVAALKLTEADIDQFFKTSIVDNVDDNDIAKLSHTFSKLESMVKELSKENPLHQASVVYKGKLNEVQERQNELKELRREIGEAESAVTDLKSKMSDAERESVLETLRTEKKLEEALVKIETLAASVLKGDDLNLFQNRLADFRKGIKQEQSEGMKKIALEEDEDPLKQLLESNKMLLQPLTRSSSPVGRALTPQKKRLEKETKGDIAQQMIASIDSMVKDVGLLRPIAPSVRANVDMLPRQEMVVKSLKNQEEVLISLKNRPEKTKVSVKRPAASSSAERLPKISSPLQTAEQKIPDIQNKEEKVSEKAGQKYSVYLDKVNQYRLGNTQNEEDPTLSILKDPDLSEDQKNDLLDLLDIQNI